MKKILLAVVLGVTVVAVAQDTAQPAQGQSGAAAQGPVIKDPAEYNAYVAAVQQKDPSAKISGLEAFLTQYPNSVMKGQALELLMGAYQQANNSKKTMETAAKVVAANPCNMRALALLAFYNRMLAQNGDPSANLADGKKYAEQGQGCWPKITDPEDHKDEAADGPDFWLRDRHCRLSGQRLPCAAATALKPVVDANPTDFSVVYPLALAYLNQTPPDYQNGIWYAARAAAVAPAQNQAGIEKYARSQYIKFHGSDDGWAELLAAAKANGQQMPIKPAPTPAEQAHDMVVKTPADKMDFAQWEFVLTNGSQEDQDAVWNAIKGKAVQMNGTIISTTPDEFMIAGSSDDIDAKKPDITLKFAEKVPVKMIPKDGASFDFQGEPASYTPNPFMMVMEKGTLLRAKPAATAPTHKAPVHKKPAAQ